MSRQRHHWLQFHQPLRRDLPGDPPTILAPAAVALLAAIGDDGVPIAVGMETGEVRAEVREDRARTDAEMREMWAEWRASREAFEKRVIQLIEQQGTLNGLVDGLRNPMCTAEE